MADDQVSSPMHGFAPAPAAGGGDGNFYGPNMPGHISQHAPTPGESVPSWVQFAPGGFAPGPMETPSTSAIPVGSTPGGSSDSHADSPVASPMQSYKPAP